jgi:hypothetical protein
MRQALHALRDYKPVMLVAAAAVALTATGAATKQQAITGAGIAFLGVAAGSGLNLSRERRTEAAQAAKDRHRDLDETRRLLQAALNAGPVANRDPMLIATLVNALAYHGLGVDPVTANGHLHNLGQDESRQWAQEQLERINKELGT